MVNINFMKLPKIVIETWFEYLLVISGLVIGNFLGDFIMFTFFIK
jgi:hypothetical protein